MLYQRDRKRSVCKELISLFTGGQYRDQGIFGGDLQQMFFKGFGNQVNLRVHVQSKIILLNILMKN